MSTPHAVQSPAPDALLYMPATHATHAAPSGPVYPARHAQSVMLLLPEMERVCAGQVSHEPADVAPTAVE